MYERNKKKREAQRKPRRKAGAARTAAGAAAGDGRGGIHALTEPPFPMPFAGAETAHDATGSGGNSIDALTEPPFPMPSAGAEGKETEANQKSPSGEALQNNEKTAPGNMEGGEQQQDATHAAFDARGKDVDALAEPPFPMPTTGAEGAGKDDKQISPKRDNDGCAATVGMMVQCNFSCEHQQCMNEATTIDFVMESVGLSEKSEEGCADEESANRCAAFLSVHYRVEATWNAVLLQDVYGFFKESAWFSGQSVEQFLEEIRVLLADQWVLDRNGETVGFWLEPATECCRRHHDRLAQRCPIEPKGSNNSSIAMEREEPLMTTEKRKATMGTRTSYQDSTMSDPVVPTAEPWPA